MSHRKEQGNILGYVLVGVVLAALVIGGIFELFEDDAEAKVPFLGDIPLFGYLFKTKGRTNNKTELLVFITPKVLTERLTAK